MKLDTGGCIYEGNTKEEILENINEHFEIVDQRSGYSYTYIRKQYFIKDFDITKSEAQKILDNPEMSFILNSSPVWCIVRAKLLWYSKYGKERKTLFDL